MPILFSEGVQKGRISLARFVALTASNPAKIFGLYPKKGTLFPGADADIVIIDPARSRVFEKSNLHTRAGYSAYEGLQVDCVMHKVFCRGQEIAADNRFLGKRGGGRLLFREPAVKKGRERL